MILIAGGSGNLGRNVVRLLAARGLKVRVLTRDPRNRDTELGHSVEWVSGNVRDLSSIERAMIDVDIVISAVHGFSGKGEDNPRTIDHLGNRNLIDAARRNGVRLFILTSVHGAAADHPMELFRMKSLAEEEVRASGLGWTIIRPTAYMETWATLVGAPLINGGKARIFGGGCNPINFVSVRDVARIIEQAVVDPGLRNQIVEVGGPENLTMRQVVDAFSREIRKDAQVSAVPLPMMRAMSVLMRPINQTLARQIQAGIVMDTTDQTFDASELRRRFPSLNLTRLSDVVQLDYGAAPAKDTARPS